MVERVPLFPVDFSFSSLLLHWEEKSYSGLQFSFWLIVINSIR